MMNETRAADASPPVNQTLHYRGACAAPLLRLAMPCPARRNPVQYRLALPVIEKCTMSQSPTLEHLCREIIQMEVSSRIRAIELIQHSLDQSAPEVNPTPQKRGRLSELKGIGKGTWEGIDIDQFIREERDSWDS